ncbi:MAG: hypothetical protein P1U85_02115 [Verrucomicrobiales bacterium]|nr:hypothetical protein [Verrucomicrobiales bacterium]
MKGHSSTLAISRPLPGRLFRALPAVSRFRPWTFALLVLLAIGIPSRPSAQIKVEIQTAQKEIESKKEAENAEPEDSPEVIEERKQELFRRSSEAYLKRSGHLDYLEATAEELKKSIRLGEIRGAEVDKLVEATFEELIGLGVPAIAEQFSKYSDSYREGRLASERAALRNISVSSMPDLPDPCETKTWTEGIAKLLDRQEAKTWKGKLTQQRKKERKEDIENLEEILDFRQERDEKFLKNWIDQRVVRIIADLSLSEEKEETIRTTGKSFLEDSLKSIAASSLEQIKEAAPLERKRILKMAPSRSPIHVRPEEESQKLWETAISKHLTKDQLERLAAQKEKRLERNVEAVTLLAYHSLDRYLRFSVEQESEILPIIRERVQTRAEQYPRPHLPPLTMSSLIAEVRREEFLEKLGEVLAPEQKEHLSLLVNSFTNFSTVLDLSEANAEDQDEKFPESVATQRFVGLYMKERLDWERKRRMIPLLSRIDELHREFGLDESDDWKLRIAAKGAVTREIAPLDESLPRSVESQIERAIKAGNEEQRLQIHMNLPSNHLRAEKTSLWKDTVFAVLASEEKTEFEEMQKLRLESEIAAVVEMALSEIDSILFLSDRQRKKLRPLFEKGLREYLPYFKRSQIFSRNWFEFFSGGVMVALKTIPEEERDFIFTVDQMEIWDSQYERRVQSSWNRVVQIREEEEKAKADPQPENLEEGVQLQLRGALPQF